MEFAQEDAKVHVLQLSTVKEFAMELVLALVKESPATFTKTVLLCAQVNVKAHVHLQKSATVEIVMESVWELVKEKADSLMKTAVDSAQEDAKESV